jgi:hypothetical protein
MKCSLPMFAEKSDAPIAHHATAATFLLMSFMI